MKTNTPLSAFAMGTPDLGYQNQLIGALTILHSSNKKALTPEKCFLLPEGITQISDMRLPCCYNLFSSYKKFKEQIFKMLDIYLNKKKTAPQIFITAYNMTESQTPEKNVDNLCRAVKEYYKEHHLGTVFTCVLTSKAHNYKYVDLINVPKHLLTFYTRLRLLQNKKLRNKTLITVGTIHKFNASLVAQKKEILETALAEKASEKNKSIKSQIRKIQNYIKSRKHVAICLGGRVEGSEIVFDLNYAKSLLEKCQTLSRQGYGVAIVNGPRTPNDVTEFLYEHTKDEAHIVFHNCKRIAANEQERNMWRIYSGKYEEDFKAHAAIGNIYPGLLGYPNTLVVHTVDSYSCCETISAKIPTAISSSGIYINPNIRIDCLNMYQLMTPKYALDFDKFVNLTTYMKIEPQHLHPVELSNPLRVFEEAVRHRLKH